MSDRLPPLTALRAFDAAARHLSFANAAAELHVTPAALSYQIKSLEEHLGAPLFRRLNRAVELTEAGELLSAGVAPSFVGLQSAWRRTRDRVASPHLVVTAGPAYTAKWLAPRLYAFAAAHPELELRMSASLKLVDFDRDDVDVAIRFGPERSMPGLFVHPILEEWVTPMMSPQLAQKITEPAGLATATLLHQDDLTRIEPDVTWARWFAAAGLGAAPKGGPRFSQADHAIDAAAAGAGVVLGRISLGAKDLEEGRLVAPFDLALSMKSQTRFICAESAMDRPAVRAFFDWLTAQMQLDPIYARGRQMVPVGPA